MTYRIIAEGPGKRCLTWTEDGSKQDAVIAFLVEKGYNSFKVEEEDK